MIAVWGDYSQFGGKENLDTSQTFSSWTQLKITIVICFIIYRVPSESFQFFLSNTPSQNTTLMIYVGLQADVPMYGPFITNTMKSPSTAK